MKDISPLYDRRVIEILGFDPNPPQEGKLPFQIDEVARMNRFPVTSDIALEFAGRMRNQLSTDPETKFAINSQYLLTAHDTGDVIIRTYHGYLPGKSARIQRYDPVQRLTFKKVPTGNPTLSKIEMSTHADRPWSELTIEMDGSEALIEASTQNPHISLRIKYPGRDQPPLVYLNGGQDESANCAPPTESRYGYGVFERHPSSVIIPTWFRGDQVLIHMSLHEDLKKNPFDTENTSDHQYHLLKDPLYGAMIQWAP